MSQEQLRRTLAAGAPRRRYPLGVQRALPPTSLPMLRPNGSPLQPVQWRPHPPREPHRTTLTSAPAPQMRPRLRERSRGMWPRANLSAIREQLSQLRMDSPSPRVARPETQPRRLAVLGSAVALVRARPHPRLVNSAAKRSARAARFAATQAAAPASILVKNALRRHAACPSCPRASCVA